MSDIIDEVFMPCLAETGFYLDTTCELCCKEGLCYSLDPDKGSGYFWAYCHHRLFSVFVQDFVFHEDLYLQYRQPEYICISCYDSVCGEELEPVGSQLTCNYVKGHASGSKLYKAVYRKNVPIRSVGIVIIPDYYENYINTKYPGEYRDLRTAFSSVNGLTDFPELMLLFRQIRNYRGSGISAKLYYEGKVAEALALVVERTIQNNPLNALSSLSVQDINNLSEVMSYINGHFASDIQLSQLARIACMGKTKLKATFKQANHCTITEFIQKTRMNHAGHLLTSTDLKISQISQMVGYKNTSRFCELFRKSTDLTPMDYRKRTRTAALMNISGGIQ
ncbi:helix-turn-helix transcriptional regulator [Paenibacillus sp. HN-1]|uniref:helix-turn-helix domain-containing protein n=1 Tax=Paenibacillus TaxID=44249 RepID=UPI001CA801AB|nr:MULTISPECIES: AraC family transcriptional regulator [Paenibacillus]MBY9080404.1 helix-turn-helix transcriptional regulator [Paenibacillus sp. CGMCC 1.18879]MBY9083984.1 helix-turn-helix transcriptional regulator [Paenibacillus sinensis]